MNGVDFDKLRHAMSSNTERFQWCIYNSNAGPLKGVRSVWA